jgi:hypothetical protein
VHATQLARRELSFLPPCAGIALDTIRAIRDPDSFEQAAWAISVYVTAPAFPQTEPTLSTDLRTVGGAVEG